MFSLQGRVALVTGASRGLGRAMARGLAAAGALVVIAGRDRARLEETASLITAGGGQVGIEAFDLIDEAACIEAVANIVQRHGRLDILVNNAGIITWSEFHDSNTADFRHVIENNLVANYVLSREASRPMRARGWGRILHIGSVLSVMGREKTAAYVASKHGIAGLARNLAADLGRFGITSNAILPGYFMTEINDGLKARPGFVESVSACIPAGRWGAPDEMIGAAVFLASDAASYVNGHLMVVDGGLSETFCMPAI